MTITANDLIARARAEITEITPQALDPATLAGLSVIDVREPGEYAQGHLPGAINLPRGVLEFQIEAHPAMACSTTEALQARDRPLLVYCLTGGRSALAALSLQELGFRHVRSMAGGVKAWSAAGLPLSTD
ncbi:MAG TPA: sulfurtransferase [Xanthomonadaceae bacterium]|nr:sulfurtransferase [Xanthomonadaceae bacterium]